MSANNAQSSKTRYLSLFSLVMITVVSVDSIRNLPATALFGSQLIFFFLMAVLLFLLPTGLVSAELSSGASDRQGGIFVWAKSAFGPRWALASIWFQWIENIIWYPTLLSFVAGTIGYLINPALADNPVFIVTTILTLFWGATFVNMLGMQMSAKFSDICAVLGLLLPMGFIIGLGAHWVMSDQPVQISLTAQSMIPNWQDSDIWISLTGIVLSFCGIEIAAVHANDVKNPTRTYPKALFIAIVIIASTLLLGSLSIAAVLPHDNISLVSGIMQAFDAFLSHYHLQALLPWMGLALVFGGLGSLSNWIIAPARGLLLAAEDGLLPRFLAHHNRHDAPSYLLLIQALIVSVLSLSFLLIPSVNGSYWLLTALAAQLYMMMYVVMLLAAIKLRYKHPTQPR